LEGLGWAVFLAAGAGRAFFFSGWMDPFFWRIDESWVGFGLRKSSRRGSMASLAFVYANWQASRFTLW
jgi:hypothetical protein